MNTPMGQPMQPMPGQPMPMQPMQPVPQPQMMKPPTKPRDPAKKQKIILIVSICSGVLVLGVAAAIIIPIILRVDYGPTYSTVKELKTKIDDIHDDSSCNRVVEYVDSVYTDRNTYNEYIERCKRVNDGVNELIDKLGDTSGVKKNSDISHYFEKLKNDYVYLSSISEKLDDWRARHDFKYTVDKLSYTSSEAEITAAANFLINSGDDTFKAYGEGWLEQTLGEVSSYRNWRNATENKSELYDVYTAKKKERSDWISANKLDIKSIVPLNLEIIPSLYSDFERLYATVSDVYEQNYNYGSHDCLELANKVTCD